MRPEGTKKTFQDIVCHCEAVPQITLNNLSESNQDRTVQIKSGTTVVLSTICWKSYGVTLENLKKRKTDSSSDAGQLPMRNNVSIGWGKFEKVGKF